MEHEPELSQPKPSLDEVADENERLYKIQQKLDKKLYEDTKPKIDRLTLDRAALDTSKLGIIAQGRDMDDMSKLLQYDVDNALRPQVHADAVNREFYKPNVDQLEEIARQDMEANPDMRGEPSPEPDLDAIAAENDRLYSIQKGLDKQLIEVDKPEFERLEALAEKGVDNLGMFAASKAIKIDQARNHYIFEGANRPQAHADAVERVFYRPNSSQLEEIARKDMESQLGSQK